MLLLWTFGEEFVRRLGAEREPLGVGDGRIGQEMPSCTTCEFLLFKRDMFGIVDVGLRVRRWDYAASLDEICGAREVLRDKARCFEPVDF